MRRRGDTILRYDLGLEGLSAIPQGSLVLFASHLRRWRDSVLIDASMNGIGDWSVLYMALSELPGAAAGRWQDELERRIAVRAEATADERCGQHYPSYSDNSRKEEDAAWHANRNSVLAGEVADLRRAFKKLPFRVESVERPTVEKIAKLESVIDPLPMILVVDDLACIRTDKGKSGSSRTIGDHARALKDLAVETRLIVIAGMHAPQIVNKKEPGVGESSISLSDLGPFGSPDSAADVLVTAYIRYREVTPKVLVARYGVDRASR